MSGEAATTARLEGAHAPEVPVFFARYDLASSQDAGAWVRRLVEVAWLLMAEGHPIIEDMEGALARPELMQMLKVVLAEFLADVDQRLAGTGIVSAHALAVVAEHGCTGMASLPGAAFIQRLRLADPAGPELEFARAQDLWSEILSGFPIELVDPLQPDNQGAVLLQLRQWTRLCSEAGVDTGFLVELMKAV